MPYYNCFTLALLVKLYQYIKVAALSCYHVRGRRMDGTCKLKHDCFVRFPSDQGRAGGVDDMQGGLRVVVGTSEISYEKGLTLAD